MGPELALVRSVVEISGEAAAAAYLPAQRRLLDAEKAGAQLLALAVVPSYAAGHRAVRIDRFSGADADKRSCLDALAAVCVIQLDTGWPRRVHLAVRARELVEHGATETPEE